MLWTVNMREELAQSLDQYSPAVIKEIIRINDAIKTGADPHKLIKGVNLAGFPCCPLMEGYFLEFELDEANHICHMIDLTR